MILFEYSLDLQFPPSQHYFHSPRFFIMGSQHLHSSMFTHPMNATLQILCILLLSFLVLAAEESRTPHELFFTS